MARLLVYIRHNTQPYWTHIANSLSFASSIVTVGELRRGLDINIMPGFYRALSDPRVIEGALLRLGEQGVLEISQRCRLLRSLPFSQARAMVGAMWHTLEVLTDEQRPDLFLSFMVDSYVLDIWERILKRRRVPF